MVLRTPSLATADSGVEDFVALGLGFSHLKARYAREDDPRFRVQGRLGQGGGLES